MTGSESVEPADPDRPRSNASEAALMDRVLDDSSLPSLLPRQFARRLHTARGTRRHLRAIRMLLNGMLMLALLYTITLTKALLIPLVLAAFIGLALNPIVATGARFHLPRWLTASVLMIGLVVGITTSVSLLVQPAVGWFHGAPSAIKSFVPKFRSVTKPLEAANGRPRRSSAAPRARPPRPRRRFRLPPGMSSPPRRRCWRRCSACCCWCSFS